ncbi:hypothetical protein F7725_009366, partial [Dissostichus mawsoni]
MASSRPIKSNTPTPLCPPSWKDAGGPRADDDFSPVSEEVIREDGMVDYVKHKWMETEGIISHSRHRLLTRVMVGRNKGGAGYEEEARGGMGSRSERKSTSCASSVSGFWVYLLRARLERGHGHLHPSGVGFQPITRALLSQTSFSPSPLLSTTPSPINQSGTLSYSEPLVHPYSDRKASDWALPVRNSTIILGDSNIARIPEFNHSGIQADSFPGATLRHITLILLKHSSPIPSVSQ